LLPQTFSCLSPRFSAGRGVPIFLLPINDIIARIGQ
jgi:hypothetical protein